MPDDDDNCRPSPTPTPTTTISYFARGVAEAGQNTRIGVANLGDSDDNSRFTGIQEHFLVVQIGTRLYYSRDGARIDLKG